MGISEEKALSRHLWRQTEGAEEALNKKGSGYGFKRGDRHNLTMRVYNQ